MVLLVGLRRPSAQLDQIRAPHSPTRKEEVELYQQLQGKVPAGPSSRTRSSTLVQPEGREWRNSAMVGLRIISGVLIVGMLAGLARLLPVRGTIRIGRGRAGTTVPRFMPASSAAPTG